MHFDQTDAREHDVAPFVHEMGNHGVRFYLEAGRLKSAGSGDLTSAAVDFVRRHKARIIAHLLSQSAEIKSSDGEQDATVPLSYQQESLWLLNEIAERSEEYNSVTAFCVRGDLDRERLCSALRHVVEQNEVLRTVYRLVGEATGQVVLDADLQIGREYAATPEDALARARARQRAESEYQFDLSSEIPVRCWLVEAAGNECYVVVNVHHIASDGWSNQLIWQQVGAYYDAPGAGHEPAECSYSEYARWQRRALSGDILDTLVGHWRDRLDGAPLVHSLPVDGSLDAPGQVAGVLVHRIAGSSYEAFARRCVAAGANEFAGLHSALAILVALVSGQEETIVGSPIANRELSDIQATLGFFVNMISVRGAVRPDSMFGDVLTAKMAEIEFGYTFQQVPFERVVEKVVEGRNDKSPIFQIVLALQNYGPGGPTLGDLEIEMLPEAQGRSRFDLEVFVSGDGGNEREVLWVYDGSLFEAETIERWAGWFSRIIETCSEGLEVSVADLRGSLTADGPDCGSPEPQAAGVVDVLERIEAVVARDPGRIAVSDDANQQTYGQLSRRAHEIGAALAERYGRRGVFAIDMERSVELVQTIVGIMSIGATYFVLDREDGAARRAMVLTAGRPWCLLTSGEHGPLDGVADLNVVDVRELTADLDDARLPTTRNDDLYYVFTSGSTGQPKGVRVTYGNLGAYLGGVVERLHLSPGARYCWQSNVTTDFGNTILFGALATGGRLDIAARDDVLDGAAMRGFLQRHATDVVKITPSHLEALLETHPIPELLPRSILVLGGEAASPAVIRALRDVPAGVAVYNHYGPSETTVGVFVADLGESADPAVLPIGRPLPAVGYAIETADGGRVPYGAAGELVIWGDQVAAGYLGEPADGRAVFLDCDGVRGYRTGDWVRQRNDGQLVFLGRRDNQVKVRGYRVELGEVKAALESAAGVSRAEVLIEEDPAGTRRMVAFVQSDGSADSATDAGAELDAQAVVDQWREVYDLAYTERVSGDIEFNVSGWISSYDGERIPEQEMRSWLATTLERISSLEPRSVLEIGCGLGIIAYPLSRQVENYLACDFSSQIIAMNEQNSGKVSTGRLSFFTCEAIDIADHVDRIRAAAVDTVVINSVTQYLPTLSYLNAVLDEVLAIDCVRNVFIGDVRNFDLLDEFSLSVVDAHDPNGDTHPGLERLLAARTQSEQVTELLVSDVYWGEFAAQRECVAGVSVLPRIGPLSNELFDFRYDVILTKDQDRLYRPVPEGVIEIHHAELAEADELWRSLADSQVGAVVVRGIQNPRTSGHCDRLREARAGLGLDAGVAGQAERGPAETVLSRLRQAVGAYGLRTSEHYARNEHGSVSQLDVVVFPGGLAQHADSAVITVAPKRRSRPLSSTPTASRPGDRLARRVADEVAEVLPGYLRPDQVVVVPAFPLNKTGKLDRHALRLLAPRQSAADALGELAGETETKLARILQGLLGNSVQIDRESDFFAIGGHSLLATRYAHAVNREFGRELRAKSVFDRPKLRDFAELVATSQDRSNEITVPGDTPREDLAISPLQQRFWTMAKSSGPSTLYNTTMLLELTGPLSVGALRAAFERVVAHHEVLRSYFSDEAGAIRIRLREASDLTLSYLEIPGLSRERAERVLMERINRPFNLETGPLLEAALVSASAEVNYLMLCIHHIISDGASEALLLEDLQECYEACLQGREPHWRDDGASFFRYLAEVEEPSAESLDFWASQLAGAPARHALPLDGERTAPAARDGRSVRSMLSAETTAALTGIARRHRTTTFVVLNALVGLFFSLLSGEDDIVIGAPADCRETEADGAALGMYINTIPIRHRIDWTESLDSLIVAEREFFRNGFAHRHVPFDQLVEHLNPQRVSGMNPIFQIMLPLQPDGSSTFAFADCLARPIKAATIESKFDLTLNSKVTDGRLVTYWEYRQSLFSAQRIESMAEFFESFVGTSLENSGMPLGELPFADNADGERSLALVSGPAIPLTDQSYLDAIARRAAAHPQLPAIRSPEGAVLDYGSLAERSDAMAALLHDKGVRKGDLVAVCLTRSAEYLVTMLAVNKVGAAYVPMDSEYLRQNAAVLLREHRIAFAVTEDGRLPTDTGEVVVVRPQDIPETAACSAWTPVGVQHSDLCYVLFTSGSTGRPKGVAVSHGSVVNYLAHCSATYLDHQPQAAVVTSPQSFDATVTTTLFALAAGLTLLPVGEGDEISGLEQLLARERDRFLLKLTPSHLVALSNLGVTQRASEAKHVFVIGGEDLKAAVIAPWFRAFGQSEFFNEYGPTEATVGCIVHKIGEQDVVRGSVRIGLPICNTTIAVLHREQVCVRDQHGEIVILGSGLARGYLDDGQQETGFRAVPSLGGAMGYHTGDIGSFTGTEFRYHGRLLGDIKVRGFRISLPEVEAAIGGVEGVMDCACTISADGQRLCAHIVLAASVPRTRETETEMRNALRRNMPSYLVPDTIALVANLPLTANGKVDLARLVDPLEVPIQHDDDPAPAGEVMGQLVEIWQQVLGVSGELPADASFFSLGGNSLSVTLLLMRLNAELDAGVTLDTLYRHPTLSEQCALLTPVPFAGQASDSGPVASASEYGEVRLTTAQSRFFFLEKLGTGADHAISVCFHIDEGIDVDHLRSAVIALLDRHPILKSRISELSGFPMLVPGEETASSDCIGAVIPCCDGEDSLEQILRRRNSAVNIFTGPLCRAFLYRMPDGSVDLQLIVHHIVFDGWSESVVLKDLTRLYAEIAATGSADPGRSTPFQQYAARAAGAGTKANTEWWIDVLADAPAAHDLPRTEREVPAGEQAGVIHRVVEGKSLELLNDASRRLGVTQFNVVHSALALAICTLSSQTDVVIGVPIANRVDATYRDTVGLFMETLPMRSTIGADATFGELVHQNHMRFSDALERTDFRVEEVMSGCASRRGGSRGALYGVMLSFHDEGGSTLDFAGIPAKRILLPTREPKLDLIVDVKMVGGRLNTYWEYDTAVLSDTTVHDLVDSFSSWLAWGLTQPEEPVRARDLAGPSKFGSRP